MQEGRKGEEEKKEKKIGLRKRTWSPTGLGCNV